MEGEDMIREKWLAKKYPFRHVEHVVNQGKSRRVVPVAIVPPPKEIPDSI